ncbi:MAG: outer membrane lipoprotein-sorting protein [Luteolibacter sp.]|uniref:outer membrane lipoprotein-sorting protein n=1 Tax=Luteolibacter sp. TaxID=1962973 RepID=UPI003264FBCF
MKSLFLLTTFVALVSPASAQEADGKALAAQLAGIQQDGSSYARVKMDGKSGDGAKFTLQLQVKQRRTANSTEVVYQVLWPKERAGEAVLLKQSGGEMSGTVFTPPDKVRTLTAGQMKESLLGTSLSYADVLENFFAWSSQKIVGAEVVNKVSCQVLESRSGSTAVRSWIDMKRVVPMRVEKYLPSGAVVRKIDTRNVANDDTNRNVPANLTIQDVQKGSSTDVEGSKLRHGITYDNHDFTAEGLKNINPPG